VNKMPKKVRIVKSPLPYGIEKLPTCGSYGTVTVSVMLPNGTIITNPEQFKDYESETVEVHSEDSKM
jgi:hypothetical protein